MATRSQLQFLKAAAGLALLFVLIAYFYHLDTAVAFISSAVAGWLNVFGIFHALLAAARRAVVGGRTQLVIVAALLLDALIIFFGYGLVLALITGCLLLIDALILRFAGEPIGHKVIASEP